MRSNQLTTTRQHQVLGGHSTLLPSLPSQSTHLSWRVTAGSWHVWFVGQLLLLQLEKKKKMKPTQTAKLLKLQFLFWRCCWVSGGDSWECYLPQNNGFHMFPWWGMKSEEASAIWMWEEKIRDSGSLHKDFISQSGWGHPGGWKELKIKMRRPSPLL